MHKLWSLTAFKELPGIECVSLLNYKNNLNDFGKSLRVRVRKDDLSELN